MCYCGTPLVSKTMSIQDRNYDCLCCAGEISKEDVTYYQCPQHQQQHCIVLQARGGCYRQCNDCFRTEIEQNKDSDDDKEQQQSIWSRLNRSIRRIS